VINPKHERYFQEFINSFEVSGPKIEFAYQEIPCGSLDAVTKGINFAKAKEGKRDSVVVVWGDQIGVSRDTVRQIIETLQNEQRSILIPYVIQKNPYVWLITSDQGNLVGVGRSRDGDMAPEVGKADVGVFGLGAMMLEKLCSSDFISEIPGREMDFTYALPRLSNLSKLGSIFETFDEVQLFAINNPEDLKRAANVFF
jgi:bifunctional N-acetylglucosamine-1-phosphate-uridyltransferase/glucosamine-1-phosphate-acetyltransferase GlmU-like protein